MALVHVVFGLLLLSLQDTAQEQVPSPGAVPTPDVTESALRQARPNIDNRSELTNFVDGVVATRMAQDHIAGVTLAVVRNGQIVLARGYGIAGEDGRPVDPEQTLFRIGSISKTFVWTALMQLDESGELSLDDPVNDHLPERLHLPGRGGVPVRLRHLMTHSAGLEDTALGHLFVDDPEKIPTLADYLAKYVPAQVRPAGEMAVYSNYGAALAGLIVAEVSGQPFERYVETQILDPLGMARTSFREPIPQEVAARRGLPRPLAPRLAADLSQGFVYKKGGFEVQDFAYITGIAPAGAASATATDMARYMLAWLGLGRHGDSRMLGEATARRMREVLFSNGPGVPGLAHGFLEYPLPGGHRGLGHGGATLSFMSNMVMVPELDLGIFISTNTPGGSGLVYELPTRLVEQFFARPEPLAPSAGFADRGKRFAGQYLTMRRAFTKLEGLLALSSIATVTPDPEGYLLVTQGGETRRFIETAPLVFREAEGAGVIGFREDADGRITRLLDGFGIMPMEKIGFFGGATWFSLILALVTASGSGALAGAWLRRRHDIVQGRHERLAALLMPVLGLSWLLFFGLFSTVLAMLAGDPSAAIFDYPGGVLVAALCCALIAAILTLPGVASLWPVWREKSWPVWRRLRHSAFALISLAAVVTLLHWNVIGFRYY